MAYRRKGGELLANSQTEGSQVFPRTASLSSGNYVVLWMDLDGTNRGQVFDPNGNRIGAEFVSGGLEVAAMGGGGFITMWGDGQNIFAQRHGTSGTPIESPFTVNTTPGDNFPGSIAVLESGGWVITWDAPLSNNGDVRAQLFSAGGSKVGSEFVVHAATAGSQANSEVAALEGGGFAVTWENGGAIRAQIFSASGARVGGEIAVGSEIRFLENAQIAGLASGGFVIVWTKNTSMFGPEQYRGIYAQVYSATGAKVGGERVIAPEGQASFDSLDVAALSSGGFVVTWASDFHTGPDSSGSAIKAQVLDAFGMEVGPELIVNATTSGDQHQPVVTALPTGDFVVSWTDQSATGGDTDGSAIRSQIFHDNGVLLGSAYDDVIEGTRRADTILGLEGDDVLWGGAGDDSLDGGTGGDYLEGGQGNDVYTVDSMCDTVEEFPDQGTDEVRTALGTWTEVYVLPDFVENLTGTSEAGQTVSGNALDNVMVMGAGNDLVLLQDGGNDVVAGGAGNDFFFYGGAWTAADRTDGGGGTDTIGLIGSTNIVLSSGSLIGVERLAVYTSFGNEPAHYVIKTVDGNVPKGSQLFVTGASLKANESLTFNGASESDGGRFTVHGGAGADNITGGDGYDYLIGNAGNDILSGREGRDVLFGGLGADQMRGGFFDSDTFRYQSNAESILGNADHILDFKAVDRIDLSAIDANGNAADGNSAFNFIGSAAFSHTAGELRAYQSGGSWWVEGDSNGDGTAELVIQVTFFSPDSPPLTAANFVL